MKSNKFIIGSSFFNGPESGSDWFFYNLWPQNLRNYDRAHRPDVFVIGVAGHRVPMTEDLFHYINLVGDLGHVHQMIGKKFPAKTSFMSSWEASVLTLAMIAYTNESDLIFLEQDCLAFGDWIGQLYKELETSKKKMLFGSSRCMPCAQSLFIIKHDFLPAFVSAYIYLSNQYKLGEDKFMAMMRSNSEVGKFSFGYDRDRPLAFDKVFYAQKLTREELEQLKQVGLIHYDELPDNIGKFTNDA